jgi:hypothetical protein
MVKEVIYFRLPLGPGTDEFLSLYREVRAEMERLGVEPGVAWTTVSGARMVVVEREFESLAAYEADDASFHGGEDFMALWRRMEACAESMETEIWQTRRTREELAALRAAG